MNRKDAACRAATGRYATLSELPDGGGRVSCNLCPWTFDVAERTSTSATQAAKAFARHLVAQHHEQALALDAEYKAIRHGR